MAVAAGGADPAGFAPRAESGSFPAPFPPSADPFGATRHRLPVGVVGMVLVTAGAVIQLVALVGATWLTATGTSGTTGSAVRLQFADFAPLTKRGLAYMYFSYGAWALLVLALGLGIPACVRWRGAPTFRVLGALAGVAGAFTTVGALLVFVYQTDADVFHVAGNYGLGIYLATLGLLASAFGSAASVVSP